MENNKYRKSDSLYKLVLREYLFFTLILTALFGVIMVFMNQMLMVDYGPTNNVDELVHKFDGIQENKYSSVKVNEYLTQEGYVEVCDLSAKILYSSKDNKENRYTVTSLYRIPNVEEKEYFYTDEIHTLDGSNDTILYEYGPTMKSSDVDAGSVLQNVLIFSDKGEVLYSTNPNISETKKKQMLASAGFEKSGSGVRKIDSVKEDAAIEEIMGLDSDSSKQGYLQKYYFETHDKKPRYLLIHTFDANYDDYVNRIKRTRFMTAMAYILAVLLVMVLFGKRLNRRVNHPLQILENAMNEFKEGHHVVVEYEGLEDLEEICETFNDMSNQMDELEHKRQELEEDRQKMLADISHDLKTPITVIQGYSKALSDGIVKPEDQQKYLQAIYLRSNLMEELVNAFYEYSRLDHPLFHLNKQVEDYVEFLREYLANKFEEIDFAGFNLDVSLPETKILMEFDPFQMKRVFENILSNSLKHNESGTTIKVKLTELDNQIVLEIGDDGVGIPKNLRDKIFEPFVVGQDARTSGKGSGLGLSIAKKIVEDHNGIIQLLDTEKGTCFQIRLPKNVA